MKNIIDKTKAFLADENGAETVEWVMIAAVLAAIILAAFWGPLKTALDTSLTNIGAKMTNPAQP
jgi:Flp pilus assembly pilin Flp